VAYEANMKKHSNRFNGLYGAGLSAERANNIDKAIYYYRGLVNLTKSTNPNRAEIEAAILFLKKQRSFSRKIA